MASPSLKQWLSQPLVAIDGLYDVLQGQPEWTAKVREEIKKTFNSDSHLEQVPSIPETPLHLLYDGQLVRFRCQVQDQYEPEYFIGKYKVKDKTGALKDCTSFYRETLKHAVEAEFDLASSHNLAQRNVCYCISLPGQNDWVSQTLLEQQRALGTTTALDSSHRSSSKRAFNDQVDSMETEVCEDTKKVRATDPCNGGNASSNDGNTSSSSPAAGSSASAGYNLPLPDAAAIACLVKFYCDEEVNINDVVEVLGVVCLDPSLSAANLDCDVDCTMEDTRGPAAKLPPSLVPRLHCLDVRVLQHANPLLPVVAPLPDWCVDAPDTRELLRCLLEEACLGDPLAGDFLISCLVGSVYVRLDMNIHGQFPLNISGITPELTSAGFPARLYSLLQRLTSHSVLLPLTIHNLNTMPIVPKKDYSNNELRSGLLQLPRHTLLTIDETVMQAGQLDAIGLKNLEQIGNVIKNQQCKYDFQFHDIEMNTNINILVLSQGKSLLPSERELVLRPKHSDVEKAFNSVESKLSPLVLEQLRKYISLARLADYRMSAHIQEFLQDEFVKTRERNKDAMTPERFHSLQVLSRLLSKSCGEAELTPTIWHSATVLDTQLTERVSALKRPASRFSTPTLR
ncbi:Mini-chromosome maintenance complex-binding protein [Trinorchestia longiramus]|nr:Mini-chromosome maintenance complex-binding protein [Trinorchestia longiramus]